MSSERGPAVLAGIQTDSVLSARLQIIRIYIRDDGRLVIEFRTQAKFRGEDTDPSRDTQQGRTQLCSGTTGSRAKPCPCQEPLCADNMGPLCPVTPLSPPGLFVMEHHSLPDVRSSLMTPEHLGGIEFDLQLLWSAQTFDSPYQLWRATSSYNR